MTMKKLVTALLAAAISAALAVPALAQPPSGSNLINKGLASQGMSACVNNEAHHANRSNENGDVYVGIITGCFPGPPSPP
jgi:hypothetical protein